MSETLGCGHPDKNRACGDCLDEAEAEAQRLELQNSRLKEMLNDIRARVWHDSSDLAVQIMRRIEDGTPFWRCGEPTPGGRCGAPLASLDANECSKGHKIIKKPSQKCPECGKDVVPGHGLCRECGEV